MFPLLRSAPEYSSALFPLLGSAQECSPAVRASPQQQGRPLVLIFPERAWSALPLRLCPHGKTAQSCGPCLSFTTAPVYGSAPFPLARLRTRVQSCAVSLAPLHTRVQSRAFPLAPLRTRVQSCCAGFAAAAGQTSCALSGQTSALHFGSSNTLD